MTQLITEQVTAELDEDFVVMRLGMRINALWKAHRWLPPMRANLRMLDELDADPDAGLLAYDTKVGIRNFENVLYWRSFEALREWALDPEAGHAPTMGETMERLAESDAVGLWHETYLVRADAYETVYYNAPPTGLGRAGRLRPAEGRRGTAAGRLGLTDGDDYDYADGDVRVDAAATE